MNSWTVGQGNQTKFRSGELPVLSVCRISNFNFQFSIIPALQTHMPLYPEDPQDGLFLLYHGAGRKMTA